MYCPLFAQHVSVNELEVTDQKTTAIVFPNEIQAVDLGSNHIIAQKVNGTENVLLVKAASQSFDETNLTVITKAGIIYQFDVTYNAKPSSAYFVVTANGVASPAKANFSDAQNTEFYHQVYRKVSQCKADEIASSKTEDIELSVNGIYAARDKVFLLLRIVNKSAIAYDVQSVQLYLSARQRSKRSPVQETSLDVVHKSNEFESVTAGASQYSIVALDKFTVDKSKLLTISAIEGRGTRHLQLKINKKRFDKIKQIE